MRIKIEKVNEVSVDNGECWSGMTRHPSHRHPIKILIFNYEGGYRAIRAHCPHQGLDMEGCGVDDEGYVTCPKHGLMLDVNADEHGLSVERDDSGFYMVS